MNVSRPIKLLYTDPAVLLREAESEMALIPYQTLFNSPKYQKLTEKWCAAMFGIGYGKLISECKVAINNTDQHVDSDFFILVHGYEHPFQLAEVQKPGRRRGDESPNDLREYRPERGRIEGPSWIVAGVKKKASKHYANANRLNLLIYANFEANPMNFQALRDMVQGLPQTFGSIWLITNADICTLSGNTELGEIQSWQRVRSSF